MDRTLTLHIGTPKSGTTHLQTIVHAGRERLRRAGILYPGAGYLPKDGLNQQPAVYALGGRLIRWVDEPVRCAAAAHLQRLRAEVVAHPGRTLVSAEALAFLEPRPAEAFVEHLGFDPDDVTVVITARDPARLLPSVWQQNVKNGSTEPLDAYLASVASQRRRPGVPFWTAFGLPGLVRRWTGVVGPCRVVLVTVPPRGAARDLLWRRYAEACGLPEELNRVPSDRGRVDDNISLTLSQAELLRSLNGAMRVKGHSRDAQQRLRAWLLRIWMDLPPEPGQARLALPRRFQEDAARWGEEDADELLRLGVRVVGDLDDLVPRLPVTPPSPRCRPVDENVVRDVLTLIEHEAGQVAPPARRGWRVRLRHLADSAGVVAPR